MINQNIKFKFSIRNYYLFLSIFLIALAIYAVKVNSFQPIFVFLAFSVAGVIGETIVSIWWRMFFDQKLWVYNTQTIYHEYTSLLNFIPWGVGGYLYLITASQIMPIVQYPDLLFVFLFLFPALVILQKIIFDLSKPYKYFKFQKIKFSNLMFFYFPILISTGYIVLKNGLSMVVAFVLFGVVATIAEYLFGKGCVSVISKKLWTYNYLSFDKGHFTPISIMLFAFCGFYFLMVLQTIGLLKI